MPGWTILFHRSAARRVSGNFGGSGWDEVGGLAGSSGRRGLGLLTSAVTVIPDALTWGGCVHSLWPMIAGKIGGGMGSQPTVRMGDERLIKLTGSAGSKVSGLLQKQGRPQGVLRVAVVGGGCSGLQYKMDLQDAPQNRDILVESAGVRVVVDPKSALYVTGSELDYVDALQEGGFKVKNPNAATSCSCGESFSA
jgi:iron-sulfur cluster assembly accessory protein